MKTALWLIVASALASAAARADQAACDRIREANLKTGSSHIQMTATGYAFAADVPDIYGPGTHTCSYLRDESADGQLAVVYREEYRSKTGSTDATIWISKSSGMLLREEQDGDVTGKGKGHIAYRWTARTSDESAPAGGASSKSNGKLPIHPLGRNLNDMPASVVAQGVPMVLETSDSVATVDAWYRSHVPGACARTTASEGVKYACPAGSVVIYPHEGKTQIAFVPARSMSSVRQR